MLTHTAVVCALSITLLGNLGLQALSCESELFHEAYEFSRVESSFAGYVKALCRNWLGRRHPPTLLLKSSFYGNLSFRAILAKPLMWLQLRGL